MSVWYEMVIEGKEEEVRSLLPGVASDGERPIWGADLELHTGSFPDRIREFLGARCHHLLLVPASQAGALVRVLRERPEVHLEQVREVLSGRFPFEAEAYAPDVAARIKGVVHAPLPPGVVLEGCEEKEKVDPDAAGVELYSPVHRYTYRCHGTFSGTAPGIFQIHRTLQELDFVHQEDLEIEGRVVDAETLQ